MDGHTTGLRGRLACHCMLVETANALVLIDTGFGLNDVRRPRPRNSGFLMALVSPEFREDMTAIRQVESLGFNPADVRHIVLTHLDFDHAGGIDDFPQATVHVLRTERREAHAQRTWIDRQRYRPDQWASHAAWQEYDSSAGERWFGFESVRNLAGLPPEIVFVPLTGHTLGHAGVAIDTADGWLLNAGDAYFYHREMDVHSPYCTPGLRLYQWMLEKDRPSRLQNQERLRELKRDHSGRVKVTSSHDVEEFEHLARRSLALPAGLHAIRSPN